MRRLAFVIASCVAGIGLSAEPEKQNEADPRTELRRIVETTLRKAIIPKVEFKDATVREALDFFKKKCVELGAPVGFIAQFDTLTDGDSPTPGPVPPIPGLEPIPGAAPPAVEPRREPRIQFKGERVSCFDLLNVICQQAGLEWTTGPRAIVIQPKSPLSKSRDDAKSR